MSKLKKLFKSTAETSWRTKGLNELFTQIAYPIRSTKTGVKINETRAVEALKKQIADLKDICGSEVVAMNAVLAVANAALIEMLVNDYLLEEFRDNSKLSVQPPQSMVFKVLAFESKHLALNCLIADLFDHLNRRSGELRTMAASAEKVSNQLLSTLGELLLELLMVEAGPLSARNYGPILEVLGMACKVSGQICSENKALESSSVICNELGLQ